MRETGIKRRPVTGKLSLDFVQSIPYDLMHSLLLGWVKIVTTLVLGRHPKQADVNCPFLLDESTQIRINASLDAGPQGVPESWGGPPSSFEYISDFKAEYYKSLALYYGSIVFSGRNIDKRLIRLWVLLSEIVDIVFDPTPRRSSIRDLREKVAISHAVHCDLFLVDESFALTVPANTHAVLHLPEMLSQCCPLPNVTQFIPERFVGEAFEMVKSRLKPDTQLFNKTNMSFSFRMLSGGL